MHRDGVHLTNTSVLARIPEHPNKIRNKKQIFVQQNPDDSISESIRSVLTAVDFSFNINKDHQVIMVAGLIPHVGKSFVSMNLAASFGLVGKKVLYIDADMRKAVCRYTHEGLTDVLMGRRTFEDVVYRGSGIKDFDILESGTFNMAAFELLRGDMFKKLLDELRPQYDIRKYQIWATGTTSSMCPARSRRTFFSVTSTPQRSQTMPL